MAACGVLLLGGVAIYLGLRPAVRELSSRKLRPQHAEATAGQLPPVMSAGRPPDPAEPRAAESTAPAGLERDHGAEEELPRALIRSLLQESFEFYLPGRKLSSDEYERLTDAVFRIRAARREMAALSVSVEDAERLRELREMLAVAVSDFEYVADMSLAEFTERVQPRLGITADSDEDQSQQDAVREYLHDR